MSMVLVPYFNIDQTDFIFWVFVEYLVFNCAMCHKNVVNTASINVYSSVNQTFPAYVQVALQENDPVNFIHRTLLFLQRTVDTV